MYLLPPFHLKHRLALTLVGTVRSRPLLGKGLRVDWVTTLVHGRFDRVVALHQLVLFPSACLAQHCHCGIVTSDLGTSCVNSQVISRIAPCCGWAWTWLLACLVVPSLGCVALCCWIPSHPGKPWCPGLALEDDCCYRDVDRASFCCRVC